VPSRPRGELAQLHYADLIPPQSALGEKRPERAQVVRVRLDRVRRALAIRQPRQVLVDHHHRPQIRADHHERLDRPLRQPDPSHHIAPHAPVDVVVIHDAINISTPPDVKTDPSWTSKTPVYGVNLMMVMENSP